MSERPLISCIMPTADRRAFVARAVEYFARQTYAEKELIVVDDGEDAVGDLVPEGARVRYVRLGARMSVGAKRNLACEQARGEIIAHWDDDDWHSPRRLEYQASSLINSGADVCGIRELLFYEPASGRAWRYTYPSNQRQWLSGSTLCYRRTFWERNRFRDMNVGEDARFVWDAPKASLLTLDDPTFHVGIVHTRNVSPKKTSGPCWKSLSPERVRALLGDDLSFYENLGTPNSTPVKIDEKKAGEKRVDENCAVESEPNENVADESKSDENSPLALVAAALGVGDILRMTPLVRVLRRSGYLVDLLVAPDYAEAASLLEGSAEIRRLIRYDNFRANRGGVRPAGLEDGGYDVAVFTAWSAPLARWVTARRKFEFQRARWLKEGDSACVERVARELGWQGDMPEPFAVASNRRFNLPPGTVALHPGCKPDWPWKKWHGFGELASMFESVAVVGTPSDLDNAGTYFRREFEWPAHARMFVGELSLADTAALISECAALVSNDSGLMHLGVALGVPSFGVFGITSPAREAIPSPKMFAVSKGLPCERACREGPWGRRDCDRHLECLKTLTASEVFERVRVSVPSVAARATGEGRESVGGEVKREVIKPDAGGLALRARAGSEVREMDDEISLVYYGYVFDASGYGQAGRAYIHALDRAGVRVSVVDLAAGRARQVRDPLVESLVNKPLKADFHLFHGIPPQWASRAFRLPNAIGMTVWETDVMPAQWRNALNHVLEVWLPCEYNVSVFSKSLERPVFRLPHPVFPPHVNGDRVQDPSAFLGVSPTDFVFYSIFEWQERKGPRELLEAYMRAFKEEGDAVLVVKSNPGSAGAARQTLEAARKATGSRARVELRCEAWSDAELDALHARGDCYVSLHRGEGWCYPLFEAASRGTPALATAYSGPLDYLDPKAHALVRYRLGSVRQPYVYYHPAMHWAEPDVSHASELMRSMFERRDDAKQSARRAAESLRRDFSLEAVGDAARSRLLDLLRRTQPEKWARLDASEREHRFKPRVPIPAEWYDEDYFERGRKSNWGQGYTWPLFEKLFKETAAMLSEIFPDARTYIDAGCGRGFLVRALRERGLECRGFDFSPWAIENADAAAKPYLTRAGVEDFEPGVGADVLLAFSVLESLTEEQISSFLTRARAWTKQAVYAVIPSFDTDEEERRYREGGGDDRDLSHITMRTRAFWHEQFARAGWRQDALHRMAERACRRHELAARMNWQVYVYAP